MQMLKDFTNYILLTEAGFAVAKNVVYFLSATGYGDEVILESFDVIDRNTKASCRFPDGFYPNTLFCFQFSIYALSRDCRLIRITDGILDEINMSFQGSSTDRIHTTSSIDQFFYFHCVCSRGGWDYLSTLDLPM